MALSPDGRWIALTRKGDGAAEDPTLWIVPTEGGEPRELRRSGNLDPLDLALAWAPDGRHLLFGTHAESDNGPSRTIELWRISVDGGRPEKLGIAMPTLRNLRVHPDGKQIAFDAGYRRIEIWAMENFLPARQANR